MNVNLLNPRSIGAALAVSMSLLAAPAFAISSCWQASDPPGCWLQCTFGGPCQLDSVSVQAPALELKLPSGKSELSQKFGEILKEHGKMNPEMIKKSRATYGKASTQICAPNELLEVMIKTASGQKDQSKWAGVIAKNCLK